jgi:Xaa-Pro aminopeptidase
MRSDGMHMATPVVFTSMNHARRLRGLRKALKQQGIEALLITNLPDVRYLCGFTGSNAALAITPTRAALFTDGRYTVQARQQTQSARVAIAKKSALREACAWLESAAGKINPKHAAPKHAAFDPEHTTVAQLDIMRAALSDGRRRRSFFKPLAAPVVSAMRTIKDEDELAIMREAALLGCQLFEDILPHIQTGATESAVAAQLEVAARTHGAEAMSFETIVASGERSALPHGQATSARLPRNGFVTLDFGVILRGYCSDMTRTVYLGKPSKRERDAYEAVLEAQQAAVAAVRPGITCGEVDLAARSVLDKAGLGGYFTHSTGHGVGIEIHESPRIAADEQTKLLPGMVITIEPGIYIPGEFGLRIEDMVLVTATGAEVLTPTTKAFISL